MLVPAVTCARTPVPFVKSTPPFDVKLDSVSPVKVGEAPLLMFWIVLITPEPLSEKLVELNVDIPLVEPLATALSIVMVEPPDTELAMVSAPVMAPPDVPPTSERTPALSSDTDPPRDTSPPPERPVPAVTVRDELASSALVTALDDSTPLVECTTPVARPKTLTFPVDAEPMVRVCLLVVAIEPSPEMYRALLAVAPEIDAVGVPEFKLRTANLAEELA